MLSSLKPHGGLLITYLRPQRRRVSILAVLLLSSIALELLGPQIIRVFINTAQAGGPVQSLTIASIAFLVVSGVQQVVAVGTAYQGANVGWEATNRLRADLMRHCFSLDLGFHKNHTPGALIERIDGDSTLLANFFSRFTITILGNALLVLGILIIMTRTNIWLGVGLSIYCIATVAALRAFQRRAVVRNAIDRQASAEQYGAIEERLSATEDIRGIGAEPYVLWRLLGVMQKRLRTNRSAMLAGNYSFFSANFLYVLAYAIGLGLGAFLYDRHQISLGAAYTIVFYVGMLAPPLNTIQVQVQSMQRASASIGRVDDLLHTQSRLPDAGTAGLAPGPISVEFDHVSFQYEDGESVLTDLSFSVQPGRVLGLLGRTGSGKSTITRLLVRLYDPTAGSVLMNGIDLPNLQAEAFHHGVGMVTQDVQLFRATVRDNLTFFRSGFSDADILAVFRDLDLMDWLRTLPDGLDTMLAPGGASLSAGQAQLLAFARVFLLDPGLVILDEASSRLDPSTEAFIEHAIDRLLEGRTGIIVAHRLRTVGRVDDILILDDGRIAEFGPRVDLIQDPASRFSGLLRAGLEEVLA